MLFPLILQVSHIHVRVINEELVLRANVNFLNLSVHLLEFDMKGVKEHLAHEKQLYLIWWLTIDILPYMVFKDQTSNHLLVWITV